MQPQRFVYSFAVASVLAAVVFALARLPLMTDAHYVQVTGEPLVPVLDAFYVSFMLQSTLGSAAILPTSRAAKALDTVQGALLLVMLGFVVGGCSMCG